MSLVSGASFNLVSDRVLSQLNDEEYNAQRVAPLVDELIAESARVIVFIGYEKTLARFLCEAFRRGVTGPKAVILYATFSIAADWATEFAPNTRCTIHELNTAGESLLGVDRLRLAADADGVHSGSGLVPSAVMDNYHARCESASGSGCEGAAIASAPARCGCSDMHAAYSYDAMWGWAFTAHRWLEAGHSPTQVDYVTSHARRSFFALEVTQQDFQGLTGRVRHFANGDRDGQIQLFQSARSVPSERGPLADRMPREGLYNGRWSPRDVWQFATARFSR